MRPHELSAMAVILLFCLATFVAQNSATSAERKRVLRDTVEGLGNEGTGVLNR